jgi:glutaredoxin
MPELVMLVSSVSGNQKVELYQRKMSDLLEAHKVTFARLDGSLDENRDRRNALWGVSGERSYPQLFIDDEYVGDWNTLEMLNETEQIKDKLAAFIGE